MATKYNSRPVHLEREKCFIGEPPSASLTAIPAIKTQNHLRNWAYNGTHFMYSGPPLTTRNPHISGRFYVIGSGADPVTSYAREAVVCFQPWKDHGSGESPYLYWYPDYTATTSADRITLYESEDPHYYLGSWWDKADGAIIKYFGTDDSDVPTRIKFDVGASNEMCCSVLDYYEMTPAAVSVWQQHPGLAMERPRSNIIVEEDVIPGTVIRGFDEGDAYRIGTQPSFGHLVHYTGDPSWGVEGGDSIDSIDHATRRCMYQSGHPVGYWTNDTDYNNMYDQFTPIVQPRNLYGEDAADNSDKVVLPSCVVSGSGTIKYEIITDTATYTATYTHSSATVTLIQPSDFSGTLKAEISTQNTLTVYMKATVAGEFTVYTVSLWEGPGTPPA